MSTAIVGVGKIGSAVATNLVAGGGEVVLAAQRPESAQQLAGKLGRLATATTVEDAITQSDAVIFAVWLDVIKELLDTHKERLAGKLIVDPSNPVSVGADGQISRTLPDGVSSASVLASLIPASANLVKAFGTLAGDSLLQHAFDKPDRAVLFYATDDNVDSATEELITTSGFDPIKVGGLDQAIRIEMYGDLHQFGGLDNDVVNVEQARKALRA